MAIPTFYHTQLDANSEIITLAPNEASHAVKSRRLGVGQAVRLFNGNGLVGLGKISKVERREVTVILESVSLKERLKRRVSVAVAVPKGDRQKVMVDMLTQIGVAEIIPLCCEYSVSKYNHKVAAKWSRAAIEGCKQSHNPWVPSISTELDLDELLNDSKRNFVVANADGESPQKILDSRSEVTVIVGPEGGFSESEFRKLSQLAVPSMRIGEYILRTETAAIVAASLLSL